MKKFLGSCSDSLRDSYYSKEMLLDDLYQQWLNQSILSNLSWCRSEHHLKEGFESEMKEKIASTMPEEILALVKAPVKEFVPNPIQSLRPIRSKKKRLRKKYEKLERLSASII